MSPHDVIEGWVSALPDGTTSERVHSDFWYVRVPGKARSWIPVEIEVMERTVKLTSNVIVEPDERRDDVYELLLRHNHEAHGPAFSVAGRDAVIYLVARVPHDELTESKLDLLVGQIVEGTEKTFRTILEIGFGSRLKKSR